MTEAYLRRKHDREVHASILGLLSGEESISRKQSVVSDATESVAPSEKPIRFPGLQYLTP